MTNDHAHNQHQRGKHGARVSCLTAAAVLSLFAWAPNPFILQHPCYSISRPPSFGRCPAPGPAARRLRCPSSQAAAARRPPTAASPMAPGLPGLPRRPPACGKSRLWPEAKCEAPLRNRQTGLAPVSSPGQTSSSYGGTSSLSPKLPMPPSMPMPPMPPMPPIPPAWESTV